MINLSSAISEDMQDMTPQPGTYPLSCPLSCLFKHNKRISVQDVTLEPGKYPLSCLYKHNKMTAELNEL